MTLSIKDCFRFGWETFKKRPWLLIAALALGMVIEGITATIEDMAYTPIFIALAVILSLGISVLYAGGHTRLFIKVHDDPAGARFADLWYPQIFLKLIGTMILLWLAIGIPFAILSFFAAPPVVIALAAIPAVIVSLVFGFSIYLVVDRQLNPLEALRESARITRGRRLRLFVLLLAVAGVNILGILALLVGLFVSIPVSALAMIHAYRTLSESLSVVPVEEAATA